MPTEVVLHSGAVTVELDTVASVLVLTCQRHQLQDAILLNKKNLTALLRDFFERHRDCDGPTGEVVQVPRPRIEHGMNPRENRS